MLATNPVYDAHRQEMAQRPIYIIEIAFNDGAPGVEGVNDVYFGSADISEIGNPPAWLASRYYPLLKHDSISALTERLDAKNGTSSIGSLSFRLTDYQGKVSSLLHRAIADTQQSARRQRVELYRLYAGMNWADMVKVRTTHIDNISIDHKAGDVVVSSKSILQALKRNVFVPKTATLQSSISATATLPMNVTLNDAATLEVAVQHSSFNANPVGFIKINDEIMMWTSKAGNILTVSARGIFGSKVTDHAVGDDVSEVCVLKGNPYALALRVLFSSGAAFANPPAPTNSYDVYPQHWGVGLALADVDLATWEQVGYDQTGFNAGAANPLETGTEFELVYSDREEAKVFIEREILRNTGAFDRILGDGSLSCQALALTSQPPIDPATGRLDRTGLAAVFDETNIVSWTSPKADMNQYHPGMILKYLPWPKDTNNFIRTLTFRDDVAKSRHGEAASVEVKARGMQSDANSIAEAVNRFADMQSRYAAPPIVMSIEALPSMHTLEVGNEVGVDILNVPDIFSSIDRWQASSITFNGERILSPAGDVYVASCPAAGGVTGSSAPTFVADTVVDGTVTWVRHDGHLARAFIIDQASINIKTGRPTFRLISQSEKPSWIGNAFVNGAPPRFRDSAYFVGTDLATLGWTNGVSPAGTVTLGVAGQTTDYYYNGNILLSGNTVLKILGTVRIWCPGTVSDQVGFQMDARGGGSAGGKGKTPTTPWGGQVYGYTWQTSWDNTDGGVGYIGRGGAGGYNVYNGARMSRQGLGGSNRANPRVRLRIRGLGASTARRAKTDTAGYGIGATQIVIPASTVPPDNRLAPSGNILAGDSVQFEGDPNYYTVQTGVSDVYAGGTLVLSTGLLQSIPAGTQVAITPARRFRRISGVPTLLVGAGGGSGGAATWPSGSGRGGDGGDGSGGLAIIARDIDVSSGSYDLRGGDGQPGVPGTATYQGYGGGGGAGGGTLVLLVEVGAAGNAPLFNPSNIKTNGGKAAVSSGWYAVQGQRDGGPGGVIAQTF